MRKEMNNSDMPIGKLTKIKDFLPPPEDLVIPQETKKVTIFLSKLSVDFFKRQAKKHHIKYQRMIRQLVDNYALFYSRN